MELERHHRRRLLCSKTFTNFDGTTETHYVVYELEYDQGDIVVWRWDGSDHTTLEYVFGDTNYSYFMSSTRRGYWLVSDEDQDAWLWYYAGTVIAGYMPDSGRVHIPDYNERFALINEGSPKTLNNTNNYAGLDSANQRASYYMGNQWCLKLAGSGGLAAVNELTDTYFRMNGTTTSYSSLGGSSSASVLIDGTYYLDLYPGSSEKPDARDRLY